jgi:hypothetical protein
MANDARMYGQEGRGRRCDDLRGRVRADEEQEDEAADVSICSFIRKNYM